MHHPNRNRITSRVFLCDACGAYYSLPGLTPEAQGSDTGPRRTEGMGPRAASSATLSWSAAATADVSAVISISELAADLGYGLATVWAENYSICDDCWCDTYAAGAKPMPGDDVIDLTDGGAR